MSDARRRILIVDDDEVLLATTGALLEAAGYEVATHSGAFGASRVILDTRPDLVLLDLNMPGLSGSGLAALLREREGGKDVRIFFFSSSDDEVLETAVKEAGAHGFIRKGDRAELWQKVGEALGSD